MQSETKENIRSLPPGRVIGGRWKVIEKLGLGGMGAVYKVEDKTRKNFLAAMKVEDDLYEGGVLKLEVDLLKKLQTRKNVVKLYDSGRRKNYCFMVMTLCGKDLMTLKRECGGHFSESTTLRLAISTLYAIKQIHEIGYVHRDIKPGNCMIGKYGRDRRMIYLIDFGMARAFVAKDEKGKLAIRKPRDGEQLFRGTPRYCSLNSHYRKEQGRVDDLWCWLYMLIELHIGLPWNQLDDEKEILAAKKKCLPQNLLRGCPHEFFKILDYLRTLKYEDRPDYYGLFSEVETGCNILQVQQHAAFFHLLNSKRLNDKVVGVDQSLKDAPCIRLHQASKSHLFGEVELLLAICSHMVVDKKHENLKEFPHGKVIGGRWKVLEKVGEGGMGAVYKVEDKKRKNFFAAMKVEESQHDFGVLKLEVHLLQQLQKIKYTLKLFDSGKRQNYCFMVMSLCDKDLLTLKREYGGRPFSESTTLRLAISTLYAIKQIHEIGYIHRDIKSGNCMIGKYGRDRKMTYLIDFGMVRSFVAKDKNGKNAIRKPRDGDQLFRGTPRYSSLNTHYRKEQGRVDDLWCWLHMLIELHIGLPWSHLCEEKDILTAKENCPPQKLLRGCPREFLKIRNYLGTLKYEDRPDYYGLFKECASGLKRVKASFFDPYEWEGPQENVSTALSISESSKTRKPLTRLKLAQKTYPFISPAVFKENILKL